MPKANFRMYRRMCFYLSTLLKLLNSPDLSKVVPGEVGKGFPGVSPQLLNGCLLRFTAEIEQKRRRLTEKNRVKLLTWICTIYLLLNDWSIPITPVASDLKLPPNK